MRHCPARLHSALRFALLTLLFLAPSSVAAATPPQPAADTIVGTVRAIDATKGTLRVLTGRGLAMSVVEFRLTAETRASVDGATLGLAELKAGDVVRVLGGTRPEGRVAYTIERLVPAPGGTP